MKIKLLKPIYTVDGVRHERGEVVDVDDFLAGQLVAQRVADRHIEKKTDTSIKE